jgi:hypothetical protein
MVRSIWRRTLVTTFAWAGLAWAQQPILSTGPAAKPGESTGQTFTVQEAGKAGQKCKILKSWKTPEGKTAYQVQALDTGEMMTIVETGMGKNLSTEQAGNASRVQAVATRIFHWGLERMPPAGTPMPPIEDLRKMPSALPDPEPKKMVSMDHLEAGKPTALPRPEVTKVTTVTPPEPAKRSRLFPWFSRTTEPQVSETPTSLPQPHTLASSPAPQPTTTLQNSPTLTTPIAASSPRVSETPAGQNKPSATSDKLSETLAPRPNAFSRYLPAPAASPATPQSAVAPQRVVQVLPPKYDAPAPAPSTTSIAPAANEKTPANGVTNSSGQPTTALPASSPTMSAAVPAKTVPATPSPAAPASAALVSPPPVYKPPVSYPTTIPYPTVAPATPAKANMSFANGTSIPSPVYLPQTSNLVGASATPVKRFDDTKPATTATTPSPVTTVTTPAPVTTAPPSDWRKSWGKSDDGKAPITENPVPSSGDSKAVPAKPFLPQADSKRPDPLQTPAQYDRRPADEKPSAQKSDTMLVPAAAAASSTAVKLIPAAAVASSTAVKLVPAAAVASSTAVQPVAATVAPLAKSPPSVTSMPVPLGAQSVVQAGDPGPGGVRYIPVPMVTIPDIRRAPVPPMTAPAQVYGTPGAVPAATAGTQANAFTPMISRQAYAQSTNAFTNGVPVSPAAPTGSSMPASSSNSMMAQATQPAGNSYPANPSVITAGFPRAGLANQTVPAAYQTTMYQTQPPHPSLTAVKSTPENIQKMVTALRDSLYPSQREWAAESMAAVDWRNHPQVVQSLTTAAKDDPAATVRAGCVRCLAKMKANTVPVVTVMRDLRRDPDPRVRQEAEQALSVLAAGAK